MIFDFGAYVIDVDVEKTADYYRNDSITTCDCLACRNFNCLAPNFPQEVRHFLTQLGLDPARPQELSVDYAPTKNTMCYSGFYYLCGTALQFRKIWIQESEKRYRFNDACMMPIHDDFAVCFSEPWFGVVDVDFPKPIVELHFTCILPWVMEEPHHYHTQIGDDENA